MLTPTITVARRVSYYKGVFALSMGCLICNDIVLHRYFRLDDFRGVDYMKKNGFVKKGDLVLVIYGYIDNATGLTDSLSIE